MNGKKNPQQWGFGKKLQKNRLSAVYYQTVCI